MSIPAAITAITVSGQYLAPDGSAAAGSVSFAPSVAATTPGALLPAAPLMVELDSTGAFSVALGATDDPQWSPTGFTYTVIERITGARVRTYSIVVPAASLGGVLDLATVAPVASVTTVTPYLLASLNLSDVTSAATARHNIGVDGHNVADTATEYLNRPRKSDGSEGEDLWHTRYEDQRGAYMNGYACMRARVPNHADAANQYAFRANCHSSKNGTSQVIGSFALADNTDQFLTRANGDSQTTRDMVVGRNVIIGGAYVAAVLGASMSAHPGTATPGSRLEHSDRVFLRGTLAWTNATIAGGSVLMTVDAAHRPLSDKTFSVRTSNNSNVSTLLELHSDGTLVNLTSFGASTTARVGLDGLSYDPLS